MRLSHEACLEVKMNFNRPGFCVRRFLKARGCGYACENKEYKYGQSSVAAPVLVA